MRKHCKFGISFVLFCVLSFLTLFTYAAEVVTSVSVTSASAGTQIVSSIGGGVVVTLPSNAAVAVWFAKTAGTCSSVLTIQSGVRVTPGNGFMFSAKDDGYTGQICAILETGVVAVSVAVNTY